MSQKYSKQEIEKKISLLKDKIFVLRNQRTSLTQNINAINRQIVLLKDLNFNQTKLM